MDLLSTTTPRYPRLHYRTLSHSSHAPRDTAIGSPIADTTDGDAKNEEECDNKDEDTEG